MKYLTIGVLTILLAGKFVRYAAPAEKTQSEAFDIIGIGGDVTLSMGKTPLIDTVFLVRVGRSCIGKPSPTLILFSPISSAIPDRLIRFTIFPQQQLDGLSLSHRAAAARENLQVSARNEQNLSIFLRESQRAIDAAKADNQHTEINGFIEHFSRIISFASNTDKKSLLFIQSDGRQDTRGSKKVQWPETISSATVVLCDWDGPSPPECIKPFKAESPEDIFTHLLNQ